MDLQKFYRMLMVSYDDYMVKYLRTFLSLCLKGFIKKKGGSFTDRSN